MSNNKLHPFNRILPKKEANDAMEERFDQLRMFEIKGYE
jgi:hypothetical protein